MRNMNTDLPPSVASAHKRVVRLRAALANAERLLTLAALAATGNNRTHAAKLLGVPLRTMFRHVAALGANAPLPPENKARPSP